MAPRTRVAGVVDSMTLTTVLFTLSPNLVRAASFSDSANWIIALRSRSINTTTLT